MESTVRGLRPVCEDDNFEVQFTVGVEKTRFMQDVQIEQHARELLRSLRYVAQTSCLPVRAASCRLGSPWGRDAPRTGRQDACATGS